jgi:hypothetical protein
MLTSFHLPRPTPSVWSQSDLCQLHNTRLQDEQTPSCPFAYPKYSDTLRALTASLLACALAFCSPFVLLVLHHGVAFGRRWCI